jgi:hypothetical protein
MTVNDLIVVQMYETVGARIVRDEEALMWMYEGSTLELKHQRACWVALGMSYQPHAFYEYKANGKKWRGVRFGTKPHEYMGGWPKEDEQT